MFSHCLASALLTSDELLLQGSNNSLVPALVPLQSNDNHRVQIDLHLNLLSQTDCDGALINIWTKLHQMHHLMCDGIAKNHQISANTDTEYMTNDI